MGAHNGGFIVHPECVKCGYEENLCICADVDTEQLDKLRDRFAGQALAYVMHDNMANEVDAIAQKCYRIADAMLRARVTRT